MSNETLMTSEPENTNEGPGASQPTEQPAATAADSAGQQQPAEQPAADAQPAEAAKPEGAPERYEFTQPEGSTLDDAVVGSFAEVAKELNLSQEAAQKVLDKMAPVIATRQSEQLQVAREQWANDARADREFGGDKLGENLAVAKKAMDAFASPELVTLLNDSGLGNHPEVIRLFVRAGKAISEDSLVTGGRSTNTPDRDAKRLYPNSKMN